MMFRSQLQKKYTTYAPIENKSFLNVLIYHFFLIIFLSSESGLSNDV